MCQMSQLTVFPDSRVFCVFQILFYAVQDLFCHFCPERTYVRDLNARKILGSLWSIMHMMYTEFHDFLKVSA